MPNQDGIWRALIPLAVEYSDVLSRVFCHRLAKCGRVSDVINSGLNPSNPSMLLTVIIRPVKNLAIVHGTLLLATGRSKLVLAQAASSCQQPQSRHPAIANWQNHLAGWRHFANNTASTTRCRAALRVEPAGSGWASSPLNPNGH